MLDSIRSKLLPILFALALSVISILLSRESLAATSTGSHVKEVLFSGEFAVNVPGERRKTMHIVISRESGDENRVPAGVITYTLDSPKLPQLKIQLWDERYLLALCQATRLETESSTKSSNEPVSLQMHCENARNPAFSTAAALLWIKAGVSKPTLRFGTWLSGYRDAVVRVEYDRFSSPQMTSKRQSLAAEASRAGG